MKIRSLVTSLAISLMLLASAAVGQSVPTSLVYSTNLYNNWHGSVIVGNGATGAGTITIITAGIPIPGRGTPRNPLTGIGLVPIQVDQETETPTAETCGIPAPTGANVPASYLVCNVTATWTAIHGNNAAVNSGDQGLQEAVNDACGAGGGGVRVDGTSNISTALIQAVTLCSNTVIEDARGTGSPWWGLRPSTLTLISAGSAPVATTGTGSLTSGAYITSYLYVDANGGLSLPATDAAATATTTQVTLAAPAATAGAVGWIPYITAAGGANGTEIMVPVTSSVCTPTVVETVIPACALTNTAYNQVGSNAVINANPSSTAKEPAFGTAHTVASPQPFSVIPLPFQTVYGPFTAVATISSSGNADVAQFYIPGQYFNSLTKSANICFTAASTNVATAVPTWSLTTTNQYGQTPAAVGTFLLATQTGAVTTNACFKVSTAVTGSSGKFWTKTDALEAINSTGAAVAGVQTVTAAQPTSNNPNLANGMYFAINLAAGTANITGVTVEQVWIEPVTAN